MVTYDLSHLQQDDSQRVLGPIQDDEALFLFSVVRGMRLSRILEMGGLDGYSARNFLKAMEGHGGGGVLYTVDLNPVRSLAPNHKVLTKNAAHLVPEDVDNAPLDMVFFDCHDAVQMVVFRALREQGLVNDSTVLALHDTNLHYAPYQVWGDYVPEEDGYAHQPVERAMAEEFEEMGYHLFRLHTTRDKHDASFPFRHGVTLCQKNPKHKCLCE